MSGATGLPRRYLETLGALRELQPGRGCAWVGDAGFLVPSEPLDDGAWLEQLTVRRWPGMHPDLLPIARDAVGNQYCLFMRDDEPGAGAVALWIYETYTWQPIASSFDTFLDWIGVMSEAVARRALDPLIDREHVRDVVEPVLRRLGRDVSGQFAILGPNPALGAIHRAILGVDPDAAGSLLSLAMNLRQPARAIEGMERCRRAAGTFPWFTSAHLAIAELARESGDEATRLDALVRAIRGPLTCTGDHSIPWFVDVPGLDVSGLVETIAQSPMEFEALDEDPIWHLVLSEDPSDPVAWLKVGVDYANDGALQAALHAASNALYYGLRGDEALDASQFLQELYGALGWEWHLAAATRDHEALRLARERRRRPRNPV